MEPNLRDTFNKLLPAMLGSLDGICENLLDVPVKRGFGPKVMSERSSTEIHR